MSKTISDINDVMLNRQADRIKKLEKERDQLREHVAMLHKAIDEATFRTAHGK